MTSSFGRLRWKLTAGIVALVAITALAAAACGGDEPAAPAPAPTAAPAPAPTAAPAPAPTAAPAPEMMKPSGTLTIAMNSGAPAMSGIPRYCPAGCDQHPIRAGVWETLTTAGPNTEVLPRLAASWKPGPEGAWPPQYMDWKLVEGAQFHEGWGELTAVDVKLSLEDVQVPDSVHAQAGELNSIVGDIEVLDTYELRMWYDLYDARPVNILFGDLGQGIQIVSKKEFDELGVEGMRATLPIGTGPFRLAEWAKDKEMVLEALQDHWRKVPNIETVRVVVVPEGAARLAMLKTGEADAADLPLSAYKEAESSGLVPGKAINTRVLSLSFAGNYWEYSHAITGEKLERDRDTSKPWIGNPFEDYSGRTLPLDEFDDNAPSMQKSLKFRTALSLVIPRESLAETATAGFGWAAHAPFVSMNNSYMNDEWIKEYNPDKARELLKEAGYGPGTEMKLGNHGASWNDVYPRVAEGVAGVWTSELGLKVDIDSTDYAASYRPGLFQRRPGQWPFVWACDDNMGAWPYTRSLGGMYSSLTDPGVHCGYESKIASDNFKNMNVARSEQEQIKIRDAYQEWMEKWMLDPGILEYPTWYWYSADTIAVWPPKVTAYDYEVIGNLEFLELK